MDTKLEAFSDTEMKLLRRLANRRRLWHSTRWLVLGLGICMLALGALFWIALWQDLRQEQLLLMLIAVVAPACSFLIILGVILLGCAILRWKGDRATELLLRLTNDRAEASRPNHDTH